MEKKTLHRIMGALVIVGVVIILLPFFERNKETPTQAVIVKAPLFPDQAIQVSSTAPAQTVIAEEDTTLSAPPLTTTAIPPVKKTKEKAPEAVIAVAPLMTPEKSVSQVLPAPSEITPSTKRVSLNKTEKKAKDKPSRITLTAKKPLRVLPRENGLIHFKEAVWVIQIGNFKNKANALRMANRLRANGYKAFIQHVSSTFGESTRVYVGPELKQTTARALASRLEQNMNIHGMVISYKPLAL